ncbi:MAG: hypothetical protein JWN73_4867 [Betaproteobacteria bacterium]|nr:hypothetical protein [Betaproteobacteria bacterium]
MTRTLLLAPALALALLAGCERTEPPQTVTVLAPPPPPVTVVTPPPVVVAPAPADTPPPPDPNQMPQYRPVPHDTQLTGQAAATPAAPGETRDNTER